MKKEMKYCSCWYNRFQGALYLWSFLIWGLGDAIITLYMTDRSSIMSEANLIMRYIILNYGATFFIGLKIWFAIVVIIGVPYLIQKRLNKPVYWMINGYLVSFIVVGSLAMILNIQIANNEPYFLSPKQLIILFICLILILMIIGREIDMGIRSKLRAYSDCISFDIRTIVQFADKIFKNKGKVNK